MLADPAIGQTFGGLVADAALTMMATWVPRLFLASATAAAMKITRLATNIGHPLVVFYGINAASCALRVTYNIARFHIGKVGHRDFTPPSASKQYYAIDD